jgi:hypothetical protein
VSTEDSLEWLRLVEREIKLLGCDNVTFQHRPFDFDNMASFPKSDYLASIPNEQFDVIVVDGAAPASQARPFCFQHAEQHIEPGGIIVFDDAWMHDGVTMIHHAKKRLELTSTGPCRTGVTRTDIYLY